MERAVEMTEKSVTQKLGTARASPGGTKAKGSPADGSLLLPFFGFGGRQTAGWPGRQKREITRSFFCWGQQKNFLANTPTWQSINDPETSEAERRDEWKITPDTHTPHTHPGLP